MIMSVLRIKGNLVLRILISMNILLVVCMFFLYRPDNWPVGLESLGCLVSFILLAITLFLACRLRKKLIDDRQQRNVTIGLGLGLLWTVEISINNFIHPELPLRDHIDNLFLFVIEFLVLGRAAMDAYYGGKILPGLKSGFWTGMASGAVACFTALALVVCGMPFLLSDPLNIKEWADVRATAGTPDMAVYFAYQTFAGGLMHLFVLGIIVGLILGSAGGLMGWAARKIAGVRA